MLRNSARQCLGDRTLGAFLEGEHDAAAAARIDDHVASCSTCRSLVALAARVGDESAVECRIGAGHLLQSSGRRVGQILRGKWRLDALVGEGGMAEVYAATHRNGRRAAIKILRPQLAVDPALRERFVDEGYVANLVGHPGVVSAHDDDVTEDGTPFLVMELLEGEVLTDVLRAGPLPVAEALRITAAVLDILAAAHAQGIVHRDVKPANVFRMSGGSVRLLDFGVAQVDREDMRSLEKDGSLVGTPAFMAPEQARGGRREIDARADLWSVGATLYSMLTGEKLRDAPTNQEILRAAARPIRPVRKLAPDLSPPLAAILDRALAFDPDDRWPSAEDFQGALASLGYTGAEGELRVPAHASSSTFSASRFVRRRRLQRQRRVASAWRIATAALMVAILVTLFLRRGANAAELPRTAPPADVLATP